MHPAKYMHGRNQFSHMPPEDLLTGQLLDLVREVRRLRADHAQTRRDVEALAAGGEDLAAQDKDRRSAAKARREGELVTGTPAQDELTERRRLAAAQVEAAAGAVRLAQDDLYPAKAKALATGTPQKAAQAAHDEIRTRAQALAAAVTRAAAADAMVDWLEGHPYDPRPLVTPVDLVPQLGNLGTAVLHPVDAVHTLERLAEAVKQYPTKEES